MFTDWIALEAVRDLKDLLSLFIVSTWMSESIYCDVLKTTRLVCKFIVLPDSGTIQLTFSCINNPQPLKSLAAA